MKHKIIQIANNTLALCLPKEFIRKLSLKKGDVLSVCLYNDKLVMKKDQHFIKLDRELWEEISTYEKIKLLKFLNKLGFEHIEVPSICKELKSLNEINITQINEYSYVIEFLERNEENELKKIYLLLEILFDNVEKNERELIFKIKQKMQSINHQNLLKCMNYNLEKYLILLKILDIINHLVEIYELSFSKKWNIGNNNYIKLFILNLKKIFECDKIEDILHILIENKRIINELISSSIDSELKIHYLKLDII